MVVSPSSQICHNLEELWSFNQHWAFSCSAFKQWCLNSYLQVTAEYTYLVSFCTVVLYKWAKAHLSQQSRVYQSNDLLEAFFLGFGEFFCMSVYNKWFNISINLKILREYKGVNWELRYGLQKIVASKCLKKTIFRQSACRYSVFCVPSENT